MSGSTSAISAAARPHLASLTSLRFLAAFLIVLFHNGDSIASRAPAWVGNMIEGGPVGVGLFFVLSGFILVYSYVDIDKGSRSQPRDFWAARFARLFPVYLFALVVAFPSFLAYAASIGWRSVAVGAQIVGMMQAWSPSTALAWNSPAWTLSVEAFFYVVFPVVAVGFARARSSKLLLLMALLWLVSLIIPTVYTVTAPDGLDPLSTTLGAFWLNIVKFNPVVRLPEFLIGVAAGCLFLRERADDRMAARAVRRARLLAPVAGAGLLIALALSSAVPVALFHNSLLTPLFAVLVYSLAWQTGALARVLSSRPLVLLGEASYALYILHVPLWWWGLEFAEVAGLDGVEGSVAWFALYSLGAIATSLAVLRFIERPARRWLRQALKAAPGRPTEPAAA